MPAQWWSHKVYSTHSVSSNVVVHEYLYNLAYCIYSKCLTMLTICPDLLLSLPGGRIYTESSNDIDHLKDKLHNINTLPAGVHECCY